MSRFTDPQRRALAVFVEAARLGRVVRSSNQTTDLAATQDRAVRQLAVYWQVVDRFENDGLVERIERYSYLYRLTDAGRDAATEAGIG